ncbi:MAG: YigZ family protein [Oscillospiraceae bacterium]
MTEYRIPAGYGEAEYIEKRSRFTGRVWFAETEIEAVSRIKEMRERHWDATHNVYGYIIKEGGIMRYSDDGEPQGTSGMPTLNVFRSEEIYNVCCVVTRYFGGTLLGAGGLVRAYTKTAKMALESAGISVMRLWKQMLVACSYSQYERVKLELEVVGAVITDTDYGADIVITALLPEDKAEPFSLRITDLTSGTVVPETVGEEFRAVRII